jgi:uncharacterized protein with ATP-grasp and redox domains
MKTYIDCIPCFFKQAIEACKMTGLSDDKTKEVLNKIALQIPEMPMTSSPPEMGMIIHRIIREQTNDPDPYYKIKQRSNEIASAIYPDLKEIVQNSENRLLKAVEIAIAGNIIDYGAIFDLNIIEEINSIVASEEDKIKNVDGKYFAYADFIKALKEAKTLLYLTDNAGEIVFDKILLEEIIAEYPNLYIHIGVRGNPIINDCTIDDATFSEIDKLAPIISNGSDAPGTLLESCSKEFLDIWNKSDLIISKGQGNFESLSHGQRNIFFMFIAKCQALAKDIGCNVRDVILYRNRK